MTTLRSEADRLLSLQNPEWLDEARSDIAGAMRARWQLTVHASTSLGARGAGGWCDGMSITTSGIVVYRPTGNRRSRFTLAHELAHTISENDDDTLIWLSSLPDIDRSLEQLCDVIASKILIPDSTLDVALNGRPPEAATLTTLYDMTEASWSACAVALAGRLPCDGFVAIVERSSNSVYYSARARDTHPYAWRGDTLPAAHTLKRVEHPIKTKSWWPRYNLNDRRPYYLSVEVDGDWLHTVFAESDLWKIERLHLPDTDQHDRRHDGHVSCPSCGYVGRTALYPCSTCKTPTCQRCGRCDCDRNNEIKRVMCANCTASVQPHLIEDGLCPGCR